jgi:hypothetical protein
VAGLISLNLPPPEPPKATEGATSQRIYRPTAQDRNPVFSVQDISIDAIKQAQRQATQGYLSPLADIEELALTHPVLGGIFEQRVSGLSQVPRDVVAGGDSPRAARMAEEFKADITQGAAAFREFEREYMRARLRGGALIEPVWSFTNGRWHVSEFVVVPRQFVRFDADTGEMAYASGRYAFRGTPVSAYPPGTWIVCQPDRSILDFAKRGELRRCLNDWYGAIENDGQRRQYNERFGVPFVDFASDNAQERELAQSMMENFGSTGGLVHRLTGSALKFSDGARLTGGGSLHHEVAVDCRSNWSIALLGAEQTVAVSNGDGSQQSASMHADIRLDKIQGDAQDFMADVDRYVAVQWAIRNYGPAAAAEAPHLVYQFLDEIDEAAVIANIEAAETIGVEVGEDDAYARLRWQKPAVGTRTLRDVRRERAEAAPPPPSNVVPIGGKR